LRSPHVHTICTLDPFVSQHRVVVTPVVALLDDVSMLDGLRAAPGEVAHIFDHSLEALLDPELARGEKLVSIGSEDWPYEAELYVSLRPPTYTTSSAAKNLAVSFVGGFDRTSRITHG
jgi:coenzyme A diphosphatase NUDT7